MDLHALDPPKDVKPFVPGRLVLADAEDLSGSLSRIRQEQHLKHQLADGYDETIDGNAHHSLVECTAW